MSWEYESFGRWFPHRLLVPVLGDRTPLTETLQARQYSDIYPLLNDPFETVRNLEDNHVGKRQIRAVILQRLREEGIHLPRDKRHLLFGLFGIPSFAMIPLYWLSRGRDRLADITWTLTEETASKVGALPTACYYTAGIAITTRFLTCQFILHGGETDM